MNPAAKATQAARMAEVERGFAITAESLSEREHHRALASSYEAEHRAWADLAARQQTAEKNKENR